MALFCSSGGRDNNWGKGQGCQSLKPTVPKVRKTLLMDEEIATVSNIIQSGMNLQSGAAANPFSNEDTDPEAVQHSNNNESSNGNGGTVRGKGSSEEEEGGYEGDPNDEDYHNKE